MTTLDEVAARAWRGTVHVMLPREVGQDVPGAEQARILQPARKNITPRRTVRKSRPRLHVAELKSRQRGVAADTRARTVVTQATSRRPTGVLVLQARYEIHRTFEHQYELRGLEYVREALRRGELRLPRVVQAPAPDLLID